MSEGTIGLIVIAVFVAVLLFGFLFGLWRGFNKSLVRLLLVVASIVGAFFLAPVVTKWALAFDLSNFGINIGGETVHNLGELLTALLKDVPYIQDLAGTDAYAIILEVVPQMIANVILFVVLFYLIRLVSMIIYWIIAGICFSKKKTEGKNKHRLLGSLVGVVQNFAVFLVLLVPVIGAVGIIGEVEAIVTEQEETEASTTRTTISDDDSYVVLMEAEEEEGEHEEEHPSSSAESGIVKIYNTVNEVISIYKNTWVAKFLNAVKLDALCENAFTKLSTAEKDGEQYVLKNEVASAAYVYTDFKAFKELGGVDVTNPKLYEIMKSAIEHAYKSKLAAKAIDEIVPLAAGTWLDDEPFMGISLSSLHIEEPYLSVVKSALSVLTDGERTLSETLSSTASMMKSLAGTAAKIQEATENALSPETVTDLLTAITESPETIELVADVLLKEDTEDSEHRNNLEKLTDKLFEGASEEMQTVKEAMVEIVTDVLEGATQQGVNISNEIEVVGTALDLAGKLANTASEEITPTVVSEAVEQIIEDLSNSTIILDALSDSSSTLKEIVNSKIDDVKSVEGYENIESWITSAINAQDENPDVSDDTIAKLKAIFGIIS